jgi:hypothetical protein
MASLDQEVAGLEGHRRGSVVEAHADRVAAFPVEGPAVVAAADAALLDP